MLKKLMQSNLSVVMFLLAGSTALADTEEKSSEIIIGFVKDTPQKDIINFQKKYNLEVIKPFKRICAIRYRVESSEEYKKKISAIKQEKIVRYVEKNLKPVKKKKVD